MFDEELLASVIEKIYEECKNFSNEFYLQDHVGYLGKIKNSKKLDISTFNNNNFYKFNLIDSYLKKLSISEFSNLEYFLYNDDIDFRIRAKNKNTIYKKLDSYENKQKKEGKLYLYKCINDLFGCRIILPNINNNIDYLYEFLGRYKDLSIIDKFYNRNHDGNYRGVHCYFKLDNNKFFTWELQIWDSEDKNVNINEHVRHEKEREKRS